MNIYFAASTTADDALLHKYRQIINVFKKLGHLVEDSWTVGYMNNEQPEQNRATPQEIVLKNSELMQAADIVVVELSEPSFGVGYVIGQAHAHKKKLLCLYPEGKDKKELSDVVRGSASSYMTLITYKGEKLESQIRDYLANLANDSLQKFNFIATKEIVDFIETGARKSGKSKSEFLRSFIQHHSA